MSMCSYVLTTIHYTLIITKVKLTINMLWSKIFKKYLKKENLKVDTSFIFYLMNLKFLLNNKNFTYLTLEVSIVKLLNNYFLFSPLLLPKRSTYGL